ncbi:chromosome segregation ATPase [Amycolatopsis mediterranei S699]|uniref:Chromosome partition protein Smc n=4 Tax=Amycolatopsis mediterranei TaxID=33910 RepID=A0A0H3CYI4_AMYMU|nr:chromosome segregation protein SMC [Amycolatopsis mediterranei]ADJ43712.1 chromosome segregation ATPase [Amycolatopsis mediterranei U32]AEK40421.1 chromosome segregation protein SMC [Amycolatopsis mediterranei S699]AFO75424.1 chromosome segregation ATPase [Amycolatopsis mediterranei S699]AGT82553.1 chromosome segregation ATPase [Amycolatopsis mediterranei RB]KDO10195.1 chromosome segregation protein SMC [Amycolatopsis mediterranei]
MHLKSLTLKGFKSFASATTLRFEPGITCVVGPNGSGKSNVLDALRWVMGTQGAKDLRGGKMEDVIFAGTAGRAPLGRAEVTLTIDNADGALPIEYSEVSITRRMFRDGASEYEINGDRCRLMDVQELLSDSGIGREMHVIVGQGQLSAILESKPEERRAFIEEAAGVLKHRKRKEQTLRKLANMQGNLDRLGDLTTELRRQLKPLGKQAEIARKAQSVQSELRDSRLRLLADDLVTQRTAIAREEADEKSARQRRAEVEQHLEIVSAEETELEASLAEDAPLLQAAQETWYKLSALAERLRGTVRLAIERQRHLSADVSTSTGGRDPEELLEEAERVAEQEEELNEAVMEARELLAQTILRREDLEQRVQAAERAHWAAVRAIADRREGMAKLTGQVEALRSKNGATSDEIDRLSVSLEEAAERAEIAVEELEMAKAEGGVEESDDAGLMDRHDRAVEANNAAKARVEELVKAERAAEREIASEKARVEALSMGLRRKDGAGALLGASHELPGLLGSVAALLTVEPGYEVALAAALGPVADAVAVTGGEDALRALKYLKETDSGRAGILLGGLESTVDTYSWPSLPEGARWAREVVTAPPQLRPAVEQALDKLALVRDLDAARHLVAVHPDVRAVTAEGDVFGARWAIGGSGKRESVIEVQAAVDEAGERLRLAERSLERYAAELEGARAEQQARREEVSQAKDALGEAKVRKARSSERLNRMQQAARQAQAEVERLSGQRAKVEQSRVQALAQLAELEERLAAVAEQPVEDDPDTAERDQAVEELAVVRQEEMEARLAQRTSEERARSIAGKAEGLRRAAHAEQQARERAERAAAARKRGAGIANAVVDAGELALERIEHSVQRAATERDQVQARRQSREQALTGVRAKVRELTGELEKLTDAVHRDEVLRAEQRLRLETLEAKIAEDFGMGLEDLVREYGPDVPVPPSAGEMAEYEAAKDRGEDVTPPPPMPYDRDTQTRRARRAEKDLSLLGKVNPLALEEFAALEERYKFLSTQLEDLKDTRKDLEAVIKQVDEKILEVFAGAYADVAREFETVFSVLFPGGEGRMVLTEPDDLLATGVDVEARPPGKKVKRLSLLSGGEKSLVAVGMLVAIFRARPSPFYVMDEVEAALDDTNMRRLIGLLEQLRDSSQLIIITHQKPTMEIADALYGVSMQGDGITKVISQRLRTADDEPVAVG